MMKEKEAKLLYIFILLQPFIDLITALMTRFEITGISLGIVIKGLFTLLMLWYLFFKNRSKYRKKTLIYILVLGIYCILYFFTKRELIFNTGFFIKEVTYIFRYCYFIILFISCFNFLQEHHIDRKKIINLLVIDLLIYAVMIIIPTITNTGFPSYNNHEGFGSVGWFYSANEISAILTIIYPFLFLYLDKKVSIKNCVMIIVVTISIIMIGTKAPFYGMMLIATFVLFYYLFHIKKKLKQFIYVCFLVLIIVLGASFIPANKNLEKRIECHNEYIQGIVTDDKENDELECQIADGQKIVLLSGRDALFGHVFDIYKNSPLQEKLFGIGFSNRETIHNDWIDKLIEMDLFDVLFHFGVVGFIIYMLPVIMIIFDIVKYTLKKKFHLKLEQMIYGYSVAIGIGFGLLIGHVFSSPAVSFYLAPIAVLALGIFQEEKHNLNKNKITFLSLHLGVGGIENATINSANSLCKTKDVEIICFYKLSDKEIYHIDKRIKIKYLYEGKPNKEELISSIKNFKIVPFIKNVILAFKILWKRHFMIIKEIKNIKEGIIISTRIEFTVLLNEYGNKNVLKVAQEHYHHNHDKKYIRKMKFQYGNIDYVMALTDGLNRDYQSFLKGTKTKVITMPNMLEDLPTEISTLNHKNIIFVGRLDKGKRVNEIIDIADALRDNDWTFQIVGDGIEKDNLKNQIKNLNLEEKVFLLGSKSHDDVIKEMVNSSIFIMTSVSEGLPMVLLEAMSVGLPCVAYETESGINDIITNNKDGFVIKNRNKEAMVYKLYVLMNDIELRKELGKNALDKARSFSKEVITDRWLDFIDRAIL